MTTLPTDAEIMADPDAVVEATREQLTGLAVRALSDGHDEDVELFVEALVDRHLDWIVHLVAAASSGYPAWGGDVLHVVSQNHPYRSDWPGAHRTWTVGVDATRRDLLRSPETASLVLERLDRGP